ncbi:MAG: single-stranded DNA-binding protein [Fibrobacter sp.]|nr:single-stranded DNA-binding protein [Fibrobacter sp.]MBO7550748.1 single-stranded DNA-binding protein [Fibrobacter sp.]
MEYLNKVMLIGNLGKDPEIRVNQSSGKKVVSFSIATSRRYRDNNGEQKEETNWHNIVGFGKLADIFEQLGISKGTTLYVEGRLTNRSWTDQNGQKRYTTEVALDTFQILTQRGNGQANGNGYGQGQQRQASQRQQQADDYEDDVDLPF